MLMSVYMTAVNVMTPNGFSLSGLYKYVCIPNNNEKFRSFKSKENIHKKEDGPYCGFGY